MCKSEIYYIPIYANIVDEAAWEELDAESYRVNGRSAIKGNVREVEGIPIQDEFHNTTTSESKMPVVPSIRSPIAIDPDRSLNEVLKQKEQAPGARF